MDLGQPEVKEMEPGHAKREWSVTNTIASTCIHNDYNTRPDERRIAHLMTKLNSIDVAASTSRPTAATSSSSGGTKTVRAETDYAGGIFSRLEAQFRAQQAARAMALQSTQTRYINLQDMYMYWCIVCGCWLHHRNSIMY